MKRYGWLYEQAFTKENIHEAIIHASKGKRSRAIVIRILSDIDHYVDEIYNMMWSYSFTPSPYTKKTIRDGSSGKIRELSKPLFYPDHIVHWCIYLVLYPIIIKSLIPKTYSSLKGRGQIYGQRFIKKQLRNKRATKYYLKVDIRKFYPSVNTDKLMVMLEHKIKDRKMLDLIQSILNMEDGLPIGMILSQLLANYYLSDIDMMFNSKYYNRYADDIVIFGSNKRKLHQTLKQLNEDLEKKGLKLKSNYQIYRTDLQPLDYMGYRFYRDKITLRKRILYRMNRRVIDWDKEHNTKNACRIMSYMGWIKHSDSYNLYLERIRPRVNFYEVKEKIRRRQEHGNLQIRI